MVRGSYNFGGQIEGDCTLRDAVGGRVIDVHWHPRRWLGGTTDAVIMRFILWCVTVLCRFDGGRRSWRSGGDGETVGNMDFVCSCFGV